MKSITPFRWMTLLLVVAPLLIAWPSRAQENDTFTAEELDQMLAPIALYPDPLLAQVLMACTYPAEVAEAAQWSQSNTAQKGDAAVTAVQDKPWDPSVKSLVAFPQALATMDQQPDWVQKVGDAFLSQPNEVMDSVQRLRAAAQESGNLESNAQHQVIVEEAPQTQQTIIKIEPVDPQVVYVPAYNPTVVYGTWWYPSYPPVYLPPPPGYVFGTALISGIAFGIGVGITNSLWGGCDWGRGDVDIDVNHYNNINVGNKLEVNRNRAEWNHDARHRREVPYRDKKTRATYSRSIPGADQRRDFRGREADRDKAQAALRQRGVDPAKGREKLRTDPQTRERAQAATRPVDPGKTRAGASKMDRERARAATPNIDRDRARQTAQRRGSDNAFRGAKSPSQTQRDISRGRSSRQAMKAPAGGRRRQ